MTTRIRTAAFLSLVLVAISMAASWAHLLEMVHKMDLSRQDYLTVQQLYRGWALLGIAVIGGFVATAALALMTRHLRTWFRCSVAACACVGAALGVFFLFTFPANQVTANWTMLPDNWQALRRQWEYSHAVGAALYFAALLLLTAAFLDGERRPTGR
jgi:hypothetical protein